MSDDQAQDVHEKKLDPRYHDLTYLTEKQLLWGIYQRLTNIFVLLVVVVLANLGAALLLFLSLQAANDSGL